MINSFTFSLPVKIFQICVNIIFGSVYKMTETVMTVLLAILIGTFGIVSYLLGRLHGMQAMATKVKSIFQDSAKIAQESFQTTWKGWLDKIEKV